MTSDTSADPPTENERNAVAEKFRSWSASLSGRERAALALLLAPLGEGSEADMAGYATPLFSTGVTNLANMRHEMLKAVAQNLRG